MPSFACILKGGSILDEHSLLEIGMLSAQHRKLVAGNAIKLDVTWPSALERNGTPSSVDKWLQELHLDQYVVTFRKNLYQDPEKLLNLWNDELTTVLEIEPVGHRRRLLAASAKAAGIPFNFSSPYVDDSESGPDDAATSDGSLPLREPQDLVSGVSPAIKTAWRHAPETLIDGSVTYKALVNIFQTDFLAIVFSFI